MLIIIRPSRNNPRVLKRRREWLINQQKSKRVCPGVTTTGTGLSINENSKRVHGDTDADRISDLHEDLISNILSRLPIEEAVRTCTLSKVWKYNWTSLRSVYLADQGARVDDPNFQNKVARILSLPLNVTSFRLTCEREYPQGLVSSWISAILGAKNLEVFVLDYRGNMEHNPIWPAHDLLEGCTCLKELHLGSYLNIRVPEGVINFPKNLRKLYLNDIHIHNAEDSNTDTLVLNLPALEELCLSRCYWWLFKYVEIHAPALSKIEYHGGVEGRSNCTIKVIGARLALFKVNSDRLLDDFVLTGSTVDCACLQFGLRYDQDVPQFRRLVKEISTVRHLMLSNEIVEAIVREGLRPSWFGALERLEISGVIDIGSAFKLLDGMPKLKYLKLDARYKEENDYDAVLRRVPSCLTSYLEEVMFEYIRPASSKHRFHLESFLLKNATKLKKVSLLIGSNFWSRHEIHDELSTLIDASARPTITKRSRTRLLCVFRRDSSHAE